MWAGRVTQKAANSALCFSSWRPAAAPGNPEESMMVRTYKRTTKRGGWQEEDMRKALESVARNLHSVRLASRLFHVPKDALCRRAKKLEHCCIESLYKAQLGSKRRVLTEEQERMLVDHIVCMKKSLSGLTYKDVQKVVFAFCEANKIAHPFNRINRMAGKDWLYSFMKRHKKDITLQKAEGHSLSRAQSLSRSQVNQFFDRLEATIHDQRLTPGCIFSMDGTSVPNVHKPTVPILLAFTVNTSFWLFFTEVSHFAPHAFIFPHSWGKMRHYRLQISLFFVCLAAPSIVIICDCKTRWQRTLVYS